MTSRRGEQLGWTLGWAGAFLWVAILAAVFLVQGHMVPAFSGLLLAGVAAWCIRAFSPWRRPAIPFWRLMAPLYLLIFLSIAWAVWAYGGPQSVGLRWWNALWLAPLLIPLGPGSKRTWENGATTPPEKPGHTP
ncbi:MAG: hypothetical protein AB1413_06950 [Thermodesulfobacteriota bacterium]